MAKTRKTARHLVWCGASFVALLGAAGVAEAQTTDAASASDAIEAIVVTGSSIRGAPPTGSNLVSVTPEDIKIIGAKTTADLLANVPLLNSFNTAPTGGTGAFAPALRGLPSTATLPLLNGHRLVAGSATDTNPNYPDVPSLALQRVEVVADGSSAVYGSDAIAGVVNFITRKRFSGVEVSARAGFADHYHTYTGGLIAGRAWESGSVMLALEYNENSHLVGARRDYRVLNFAPFGGLDTRPINCPTPNVRIAATGTTNYAAPGLAAGTTNYCDPAAAADIIPAMRLYSGLLTVEQEINPNAKVWADVLYSVKTNRLRAAPAAQTLTVTSANPFFQAPPGSGATTETVLLNLQNILGSDHSTTSLPINTLQSTAGADIKLPRDLNLTVSGTYNLASNSNFIAGVNATALAQALAATTTANALDPFGTRTSPLVASAIYSAPIQTNITQAMYMGAAKVDGPLMDLPAGQLRFATGAELRRETFKQRGIVQTTPVPEDYSRDIRSIYAELFVPIFGADNKVPLIYSLNLSVSGRYDHYSDVGSTTNPKVGVDWQPVEGLTVRGAYGTSFRAPGQRQIGATRGITFVPSSAAAVSAFDPTRSTQVNTLQISGGNQLEPEEAKTYSAGVEWQPVFLPGFRTSLNYFNINFTKAIATPTAVQAFSDPTFAARVLRDPSAAQIATVLALGVNQSLPIPLPAIGNVLDLRQGNFGVRDISGLDFDNTYRRTTDFGSVFGSLSGTYYLKYDTRLSPTSPVSNQLRLGTARYTVRGTVGVQAGPINASTSLNYSDGVTNNFNTPTGLRPYEAKSYKTLDLRLGWTLPDGAWTKGTELSLQINNVFDTDPPFFPSGSGAAGNFNPIGRLVAVNLQKTF